MKPVLHALLVGLVGAGIVHIAIAQLVPAIAGEEAWQAVERLVPSNRMATANLPLFAPEPVFRHAACRIALDLGAVRITAPPAASAWFLEIYLPDGRVAARLNDTDSANGRLDVTVVASDPNGATQATSTQDTFVELDAAEALAVLKVMVPDRSWEAETDGFLSAATCTRVAGTSRTTSQ